MFTGLVEDVGQIVERVPEGPGARIVVRSSKVFTDATIGDSVAINGCCLTVVKLNGDQAAFEAGEETLRRTSLGELEKESPVNLERSLKVGDRMGGHFVTGHIDCVGRIVERSDDGEWSTIWFSVAKEYAHHLAPKGSIAVEGISLTVVDVEHEPQPRFSVALIPHTLAATNLGSKQTGDSVNLETDVLAKYVEQSIRHSQDG